MFLKTLSLRSRVFVLVFLLLLGVLVESAGVLWLLRDRNPGLSRSWDANWEALNAAWSFETSLAIQKACVFSYLVRRDPAILSELHNQRSKSEDFLTKIRLTVASRKNLDFFEGMKSTFARFVEAGDLLVAPQSDGKSANSSPADELHASFAELIERCDEVVKALENEIEGRVDWFKSRGNRAVVLVIAAVVFCFLLGGLLTFLLTNQILEPIRRLAVGPDSERRNLKLHDEVQALQDRIQKLVEDVDQTQSELQQSREHLLQSEKLAMVGKLAAGVAHSVRNPLTSVKMRLFSLERSLDLTHLQKEDFDVISDEIRHIDAILQNFLEFSRPPKLKIQNISLSDVVDMSIQLLRHRLESYGAEVELTRQQRLPFIEGDPEQLKEVLVNLIINACEAMGEGGKIHIQELQGFSEPMGRVVVIQISDNGPGIPEAIRDKVFQPFFSTKEEGTGLGLSIARRIIEDHKGCMSLRSRKGKGTTFIITLPSNEDTAWIRS